MKMTLEYRAVFGYPPAYGLSGKVEDSDDGYGPARSTLAEAKKDRPWRPEESHGWVKGCQMRAVTEWGDADGD